MESMPDSPTTNQNQVWTAIGKVSLLITVILGSVAIYQNFFPKSPVLNARVIGIAGFNPVHLISGIKEDLKDKNSEAFTSLTRIRQKFHIFIENSGSKQAESIAIELPLNASGLYLIDVDKDPPKPFHRTVPVGNIRPQGVVLIEVWIFDKTIPENGVEIISPDGVVPQEKFMRAEDWLDKLLLPILLFETGILAVILIGAILVSSKSEANTEENENAKPPQNDG
jgi:hypothetical protein